MSAPDCPFCRPDAARIFHAGERVFGLWDAFPASPHHALLIPKRHIATWFDATRDEQHELNDAIEIARAKISERAKPDGWNVGFNVGAAGGMGSGLDRLEDYLEDVLRLGGRLRGQQRQGDGRPRERDLGVRDTVTMRKNRSRAQVAKERFASDGCRVGRASRCDRRGRKNPRPRGRCSGRRTRQLGSFRIRICAGSTTLK